MSYHFTFDLSGISQTLFTEISHLRNKRNTKINEIACDLVNRFKVAEITGLPLEDAVMLIKDMIDTHLNNFICKPLFKGAKEKALFLPHCSRKYMDSRCKAEFNTEISSYNCRFCSKDCLVYQATKLANKKKYEEIWF